SNSSRMGFQASTDRGYRWQYSTISTDANKADEDRDGSWRTAGTDAHCNSTFAALITSAQRSISSCIYLADFSTGPPKASADSFFSCAWISGVASASFTSALTLSMMALGVFGGATMAYQATASKPGSVSASVGMPSIAGNRWDDATASS